MSLLTQEIRATQNPALGATLIWRFTCGYSDTHRTKGFPPLHLVFLVIPILYHKPLLELIVSTQTRSGLRQFILKLGDTSKARQDLLYAIQDRTEKWKDLSLESLRIAIATKLVTVGADGMVISLSSTEPSAVPQSSAHMLRSAYKLGAWMSQLSLHEISNLLHIRF